MDDGPGLLEPRYVGVGAQPGLGDALQRAAQAQQAKTAAPDQLQQQAEVHLGSLQSAQPAPGPSFGELAGAGAGAAMRDAGAFARMADAKVTTRHRRPTFEADRRFVEVMGGDGGRGEVPQDELARQAQAYQTERSALEAMGAGPEDIAALDQRTAEKQRDLEAQYGGVAGAQSVGAEREVEAAQAAREAAAGQAAYVEQQGAEMEAQAAAREQARQERQSAAFERLQRFETKLAEAADAVAESPAIDASRWWSSKSSGQKALASLSAGLLALGGVSNPFGHLQNAVNQDIAAQRANHKKRLDTFGSRRTETDNASRLYGEFLQLTGNEREADLMAQLSKWDQIERTAEAIRQKHGAQIGAAQSEQMMAQIQARKAELRQQLEHANAANTEYAYKTRNVLGRAEREMFREASKQGVKRAGELKQMPFEMAMKSADGPSPEERRIGLAERKFKSDQMKWVADKTAGYREEQRLIREFLGKYKDDIPGAFPGANILPNDITPAQSVANDELRRIADIRLKTDSGVGVSDKERELATKDLLETWSEGTTRAALERRLEESKSRQAHYERAPEHELVEEYRRAQLPGFAPDSSRFGVSDPVQIDE